MGRRLPAAFAGRSRQSAEAAGRAKAAGVATRSTVPVAEVRALGLRPNWQRIKDFPAMGEDDPKIGLLAVVRREIYSRGLSCYHTGIAIGSDTGFPDLTIWGPGGVIFRELKGTTGRLYVDQLETIMSMRAAGADAAVWWPEDYHLSVICDELDRLAGIAEHKPRAIWRPGYRLCGCHMDEDHKPPCSWAIQ